MKSIFCIVILALLVSCGSKYKKIDKQNLAAAMEIEQGIDYNNFTENTRGNFDMARFMYRVVAANNPKDWKMGFAQESGLLRNAYFHNALSEEEFLSYCKTMYETYENINKEISGHILGYALTLRSLGEIEKSNEIFEELLLGKKKKLYYNREDEIAIRVISSRMLGREIETKPNVIYEYFLNMSEEEILATFLGV